MKFDIGSMKCDYLITCCIYKHINKLIHVRVSPCALWAVFGALRLFCSRFFLQRIYLLLNEICITIFLHHCGVGFTLYGACKWVNTLACHTLCRNMSGSTALYIYMANSFLPSQDKLKSPQAIPSELTNFENLPSDL